MDFKKLFMNNKAVSPVIGVILMVAITVILAAAIGSSVFGQGTAQPAPQANLDMQANSVYYYDGSNTYIPATVKVEHLGGDPINFDSASTKIMVSVNGTDSKTIDADSIKTDLSVLSVGDVKYLNLNEENNGGGVGKALSSVNLGSTVKIKIIDKKTDQLICDKTVRF